MNHPLWSNNLVTTPEELRELVGEPHEMVVKKTVGVIEQHVRDYLAMSPLFFLSTSSAEGHCDASPRGDEPGFVKALDERHIIFPDRPGNRRTDSLLNILSNPQVGMLCVIPGLEEVLRINGRAWLNRDAQLIEAMGWSGNRKPELAIVVEVRECFVHCPRALKQAKIWDNGSWPDKQRIPSPMAIFKAHLEINGVPTKEL